MSGTHRTCPRTSQRAGIFGGRFARGGAVALLAMVVVAGCGADDKEMQRPAASQTTTTAPPVGPSDAVGTNAQPALQLISSAFTAGGAIPDQYTCRGQDVSPPLQWANLPAGVTELALVVVDPDAGGFVHWILTDITPTVGGIGEGQPPAGSVEGPNDFGETGWRGPCPPSGTHSYVFRLLALSEPPNLDPGISAQDAASQLNALPALASATLTGTAAA